MGKRVIDYAKVASIEMAWRSYAGHVIPPQAGQNQIDCMKGSFYAGVATVLGVTRRIGEPDVSMAEGLEILDAMNREVMDHAEICIAKMKRQEANRRRFFGE